MKNVRIALGILFLLICVWSETRAQVMLVQTGAQIEILNVRNLGVSAANETKSIIEVRWQTAFAPNTEVKSFDIKLEVIYADGGVATTQSSAGGTARSGRAEVPTTHLTPGRPPAAMKSIKVSITTSLTGTITKQFPT